MEKAYHSILPKKNNPTPIPIATSKGLEPSYYTYEQHIYTMTKEEYYKTIERDLVLAKYIELCEDKYGDLVEKKVREDAIEKLLQ